MGQLIDKTKDPEYTEYLCFQIIGSAIIEEYGMETFKKYVEEQYKKYFIERRTQ